jgi:hypothetical protein
VVLGLFCTAEDSHILSYEQSSSQKWMHIAKWIIKKLLASLPWPQLVKTTQHLSKDVQLLNLSSLMVWIWNVPQDTHVLEAWFPAGDTIERWLSPEGDNFINGLIPTYQEVGAGWGKTVIGSMTLKDMYYYPQTLLSLFTSWLPRVKQSPLPHAFIAMMFCLTSGTHQWNQWTKDWNLWNCKPK